MLTSTLGCVFTQTNMFFKQFYSYVQDAPLDLMAHLHEMVQKIDFAKYESDSISGYYPAFHKILGISLARQLQRGLKIHDRAVLPVLEYMQNLNLDCLRGKVLHNAGWSSMLPDSYIDWHNPTRKEWVSC